MKKRIFNLFLSEKFLGHNTKLLCENRKTGTSYILSGGNKFLARQERKGEGDGVDLVHL